MQQAFLHDAKHDDARFRPQLQFLVGVMLGVVELRASLGHVPPQRAVQPDVIEQCRPQFLDDAALDVDSVQQGILQSREMQLHERIIGRQAIFEPRDIQSRRDQQSAHLIVQPVRDRCAELFGQLLLPGAQVAEQPHLTEQSFLLHIHRFTVVRYS